MAHKSITGVGKGLLYSRIALHVAWHYGIRPGQFGWSPVAYVRFLRRALRLLLVFRHNSVIPVFNGYKLHLYLPAYPSRAFFYAIESKLIRRPAGPTTVVFSMTKACEYRCKHCYQRLDPGAELDEGAMLDVAQGVCDAGVAMFDIEGGEPFLRFERLLSLVRALDERCEIWVNTTGAHATPERLQQLKDAGLFGVMVSIHSTDASRHDELTGIDGAFGTAVEVLKLAKGMGIVTAFNTVLAEDEVRAGGVDTLMDFARELACDYVQLIHPKPAGAWLEREEGMQRDADVLEQIRALHVLYNSRRRRAFPSLAAQVFEESEAVLGCTAGAVDRFYVGGSGDVQPCEFLNLSFGNVKEEPFDAILARMRAVFEEPCCDWLCCTQAGAIHRLMVEHGVTQTPVPWELTRKLVAEWQRGKPTPVYRKLGVYR